MKRVTIKDLAQQLGVSPSTISRALKDHPDIGLSMRQEVKDLAEKLNYRPNRMAVNLRQRSSRLIGLIIPEVTMFFYPSVIKGIEQILHAQGYRLLMLQTYDQLDREVESAQICFENDVAGLMLAVSHNTKDLEHLTMFEEAEIPVVLFDKILKDSQYDMVIMDDKATAADAVNRLVAKGCKHIVGMLGNPNLSISKLRAEGVREALQAAGLFHGEGQIVFAGSSEEASRLAAALLASTPRPDGFFAMSDEIIAGVLPTIARAGLNIPTDCSIIGISDGFLPYYMTPQVSFLHHNGFEVGQLTAGHLCNLIKNGQTRQNESAAQQIIVSTNWTELGSTF